MIEGSRSKGGCVKLVYTRKAGHHAVARHGYIDVMIRGAVQRIGIDTTGGREQHLRATVVTGVRYYDICNGYRICVQGGMDM